MKRKSFDHITANALTIISEKNLVKNFLIKSGLVLCDECSVPVAEVRRRFDRYTEKTEGLVYTREFFEMIMLTSLPDVSVTPIEIAGEDIDCFYGIAYDAQILYPVRAEEAEDTEEAENKDMRMAA